MSFFDKTVKIEAATRIVTAGRNKHVDDEEAAMPTKSKKKTASSSNILYFAISEKKTEQSLIKAVKVLFFLSQLRPSPMCHVPHCDAFQRLR